jgi:ABC-type branched-subunit amino acid transport system substrate-binding protein
VVLAFAMAVIAGACSSSTKSSTSATTTAAAAANPGGNVGISRSSATQPATWTPPAGDTGSLQCNGAAPDPHRGITDTSIKVGGIATLSNAGTSTYQDTVKAAKARFDRENANGGVFGRKINFIGAQDDASTAQQNADAGRKLAESDKVFAVDPITTSFGNYADALCQDVVPAIGYAFNDGMCGRANTFGFTGCLLPQKTNSIQVGNFLELLKGSSDKSVVLLGVDNASAKRGVDNTKAAFDKAGMKVVMTSTQLVPGQPPSDASPLVRQILAANNGKPPAMVYHVTDFQNVTAVTQALAAAGYKGLQISAVGYDPRLAAFKALDNTFTSFQWLPFEATDNPTVKQMTDDLKTYGSGATLSLPSAMGWISADMLVAGLQATGKDLTVDSFLKTVNGSSFHYGDGIFSGRTIWPSNHFYGTPCGIATHLTGGKYELAVPLVCNEPFNQ